MSNSRKIEQVIKSSDSDETQVTKQKVSSKRPFDVAFLILPDEKLKKLTKTECYSASKTETEEDEEDEEIEVGNNHEFKINHAKYYTTQKQQIFDDPNLIKARNLDELRRCSNLEQKSAFTKVNFLTKDASRASPNHSLSPDLSYQNSLSPSPPIINRGAYQSFPQIFKNHHTYQTGFLQDPLENPFIIKATHQNPELLNTKLRPALYQPSIYNSYHHHHHHQFPQGHNSAEIKFGQNNNDSSPASAAAILTTLLPPSLAALSLPAQNVCAKCNITFRMTSDLVYHMRSHHKNDSVDVGRKRREDKLKCPVCAESFRERHHLTRHMTAHQDKDEEVSEAKKKGF